MSPVLTHLELLGPLGQLSCALDEVAAINPSGLLDTELAQCVLGVQRHLDRLKVVHARLVHEADRRRLWASSGSRDMAEWLADGANTTKGEALSRVRLGSALGASDALQQAAAAGEVSAATAESLFDAVTSTPTGASADDVAQLVSACKGTDPRDARDAADAWKRSFGGETAEQAEARRDAKRSVTTRVLGDGMGQLVAVLPLLDLRQVTTSISRVAGKPSADDLRTTEQRLADGLVQLCIAHAKGEVKGGREKPTILITIDADDFAGHDDATTVSPGSPGSTGSSEREQRAHRAGRTAHGDVVPAHVVRFIAEQAVLQRVVMAGSQVLDVGREVRYATDAQYRALVVRDGGCRWPGCHIPANWCDIDHLVPWEAGGRTDLDNLVMWCRHHHTQKHLPGVTVLRGRDHAELQLRLADGRVVACPPKGPGTRTDRGTATGGGTSRTRPRTSAAA